MFEPDPDPEPGPEAKVESEEEVIQPGPTGDELRFGSATDSSEPGREENDFVVEDEGKADGEEKAEEEATFKDTEVTEPEHYTVNIYDTDSLTAPLIGSHGSGQQRNGRAYSLQQGISAIIFCLACAATVFYIIKTCVDPPGTNPTTLRLVVHIFFKILPLLFICWHVPIVLRGHERVREALTRGCLLFIAFWFHGAGDVFLELTGGIFFEIGK